MVVIGNIVIGVITAGMLMWASCRTHLNRDQVTLIIRTMLRSE